MLGSRPLRLVLLDHDQPVAPFVRGVKLNAGFAVHPGDRGLEGRDHLGAVLSGVDDELMRIPFHKTWRACAE